jgi:hypothetical protein
MATISSPVPPFTPRLVDGPLRAPRVAFLDPVIDEPENVFDRIARTLDQCGEAVFAINRHAIYAGHRQLGKESPILELPEFGAPDAIRYVRRLSHAVFAATLPPAWDTGQVRSYALSSSSPTVCYGIQAHQWLADIGASTSNRLLWS